MSGNRAVCGLHMPPPIVNKNSGERWRRALSSFPSPSSPAHVPSLGLPFPPTPPLSPPVCTFGSDMALAVIVIGWTLSSGVMTWRSGCGRWHRKGGGSWCRVMWRWRAWSLLWGEKEKGEQIWNKPKPTNTNTKSNTNQKQQITCSIVWGETSGVCTE